MDWSNKEKVLQAAKTVNMPGNYNLKEFMSKLDDWEMFQKDKEFITILAENNSIEISEITDYAFDEKLLVEILSENKNIAMKAISEFPDWYTDLYGEIIADEELLKLLAKRINIAKEDEKVANKLKDELRADMISEQEYREKREELYLGGYGLCNEDKIKEQFDRALDMMSNETYKSLFSDRSFVSDILSLNGLYFAWASEELRDDKELLLKAFENDKGDFYDMFSYASYELKKDREIVEQAIKISPWNFWVADSSLRNDKQLALKAIENDYYTDNEVFQEILEKCEELANDESFIFEAAKIDSEILDSIEDEELKERITKKIEEEKDYALVDFKAYLTDTNLLSDETYSKKLINLMSNVLGKYELESGFTDYSKNTQEFLDDNINNKMKDVKSAHVKVEDFYMVLEVMEKEKDKASVYTLTKEQLEAFRKIIAGTVNAMDINDTKQLKKMMSIVDDVTEIKSSLDYGTLIEGNMIIYNKFVQSIKELKQNPSVNKEELDSILERCEYPLKYAKIASDLLEKNADINFRDVSIMQLPLGDSSLELLMLEEKGKTLSTAIINHNSQEKEVIEIPFEVDENGIIKMNLPDEIKQNNILLQLSVNKNDMVCNAEFGEKYLKEFAEKNSEERGFQEKMTIYKSISEIEEEQELESLIEQDKELDDKIQKAEELESAYKEQKQNNKNITE